MSREITFDNAVDLATDFCYSDIVGTCKSYCEAEDDLINFFKERDINIDSLDASMVLDAVCANEGIFCCTVCAWWCTDLHEERYDPTCTDCCDD